jgi:hypothetical protein
MGSWWLGLCAKINLNVEIVYRLIEIVAALRQ